MERIKDFLERIVNRLERKGVDDLTKSDMIISVVLVILLHFLLTFMFFILPIKLLISIIFTVNLFVFSGTFIFLLKKDYDNDKIMFLFGLFFIPIVLISIFLTLRIVPYRGDDLILQRKSKLKILIRKTKLKKLKFWK